MSTTAKAYVTPEEYLALERKAKVKSEYYDGEMFAMGGATRQHVLIVTNIVGELRQQLRQKRCNVYSTDLRLKVSSTGLYTYPDVIAVCGEEEYWDEQKDALLNPTVLLEVLSESSKDYDRGRKFEHYRSLDSLKEYLLVAQDKYHVEHYVRQPGNQWLLTESRRLEDTIELQSIECGLALDEVYAKVEFSK